MTTPVVTPKKGPFDWHTQQMFLLKKWAEIASCYRWMHNQSYMQYKKKNLYFMIPLIVMSTVTGTANFAQSSFPEVIRPNVPQIIGAINLISAIMTTIYQFLKISEFMESHRISSINYGKLARNITTELNIPVKDRDTSGSDCVKLTRLEIDRLIEQSPAIPKNVLVLFDQKFHDQGIEQPEIVVIKKVDIYDDPENKTANTIADAGLKFKQLIKKPPAFSKPREVVNKELNVVTNSKLVTNPPSPIRRFFNKLTTSVPQKPINAFNEVLEQLENIEHEDVLVKIEEPEQIKTEIETEEEKEIKETVETIINDIVGDTIKETGGIQDDLELLKSSKLVSSKKE
jgi:hypothetical protein